MLSVVIQTKLERPSLPWEKKIVQLRNFQIPFLKKEIVTKIIFRANVKATVKLILKDSFVLYF